MTPIRYNDWITEKTTLIIPDLHHRWHQAERIIASVGADEVLFLGDYFDDFGDNPEIVKDTAEWLEASVSKPNRIHLFGNHDQHYAFDFRTFRCSGYEQWKHFIIKDNVNPNVWKKLHWFYFLDNRWLLSHGGLHKLNVPGDILKHRKDRKEYIGYLTHWLNAEIQAGFRQAANNQGHWVFNAGRTRWGSQRVGGLTWCDFTQEFHPVKGINQIVGHTLQQYGVKWCRLTEDGQVFHHKYEEWTPTPEVLDNPNLSSNICLDVHGNTHWATWDGKQLKLGNYKDL